MTRDMDLVREIILAVKAAEGPVSHIEGVPKTLFAAHAQLLDEAGLVMAALQQIGPKSLPSAAIIHRLTWAGQDFASAIAEDTLWNKVRQNVIKPASSWTFAILLDYLRVEISNTIPGLGRGLD